MPNVGFTGKFDEREVLAALKRMESGLGRVNNRFDVMEKEQKGAFKAIVDNVKQTDKVISSSTKTVSTFGQTFKGVFGAQFAFLTLESAVKMVGTFTRELVENAGAQELLSKKAQTVFGPSLDKVAKAADKVALRMGLTTSQYTNAAAGIQDLLIPMGFMRDEATNISTNLVDLSGSLAEWTGGKYDAVQVSEILSKAMLGEREQLKSLGISITENDVKNGLLARGMENLTGQALEQAKAVVTLELVTNKSTDAQAAFADSAGSLISLQGQLNARFEQSKESLAQSLLPVFKRLVITAISVADGISGMISIMNKNKDILGTLAGAVTAYVLVLKLSTLWSQRHTIQQAIATTATKAMAFAQRGLNLAMKANPIGIVIAAVTLLVGGMRTLYTRSDEVRKVIDGLGSVAKEMLTIVKETFGGFIQAYKKFQEGDVKGAFVELGKSLIKLNPVGIAVFEGKRLGEAYKRGVEESADKIFDEKTLLPTFRSDVADLQKKFGEIDLSKSISSIEKQKKNLRGAIESLSDQFLRAANTDEAKGQIADTINSLKNELDSLQKTDGGGGLLDDVQRKALEDYQDLLDRLAEKTQDAKLGSLSGEELVNAKADIELAKIDELEAALKKLNKASGGSGELGSESLDQLAIQRATIEKQRADEILAIKRDAANEERALIDKQLADEEAFLNAQLELLSVEEQLEVERLTQLKETRGEEVSLEEERAIQKLEIQKAYLAKRLEYLEAEGSINDTEKELIEAQIKSLSTTIDKTVLEAGKKSAQSFSKFGDIAKQGLIDGLGIDDAAAQQIIDGFNSVVSNLTDAWTIGIDTQIDENERLLESIRDRISETEDALEEEEEKAEEGRTNNVESKKAELAELQAEEIRAASEQKKLKEQQQKAQLAADAVTQVSGLVTMVANVLANYSGLGVAGPILAALAIASLFALFAKMKAQSKAAASQRAFKGGPIDQILGGRSDRYGGRGHAIEGSNVVVGGGEYLVNDQTTKKKRHFLDKLNAGMYDNVNFEALIKGYHQADNDLPYAKSSEYAINKSDLFAPSLSKEDVASIMEKTMNDHANKMAKAIRDQPIYYTVDESTKQIVSVKNGNVKRVNINK